MLIGLLDFGVTGTFKKINVRRKNIFLLDLKKFD
jgi:hypothetical protein